MDDGPWIFSGFRFDPESGLAFNGVAVPLPPKSAALLQALLRAGGRIVGKAEIAAAVWPGRKPTEQSIARCVATLRKTLRDRAGSHIVMSIYGSGVRLAVEIEEAASAFSGADETPILLPSGRSAEELIRTTFEIVSPRNAEAFERGLSALRFGAEMHPDHGGLRCLMADLVAAQVFRGYRAGRDAVGPIAELTGQAFAAARPAPAAGAVRGWSIAALEGRAGIGLPLIDSAISAEPSAFLSYFYRAWVLAGTGRIEAALADIDRVLAVSPLERGLLGLKGWFLFCARRFEEADAFAAKCLDLRPDVDLLLFVRALAHAHLERPDAARDFARAALRLSGEDDYARTISAYVLARTGEVAAGRKLIGELEARAPQLVPTYVAAVHAACGDTARAAAWLRYARDERCPWYMFIDTDPRFEEIDLRSPEWRSADPARA